MATNDFADLYKPERRALENANITSVKKLSGYSQKAILSLHGIGPSAIPRLEKLLKSQGLRFASDADSKKIKSDVQNETPCLDLHSDIKKYNRAQKKQDRGICEELSIAIMTHLNSTENKIWHGHPVWFINGNPIVGYSKLKDCVRLLFWSGQSFEEKGLVPEGSFKAAEVRYKDVDQIITKDLKRWLNKAEKIQWDYKNIVKRKGVLKKLK